MAYTQPSSEMVTINKIIRTKRKTIALIVERDGSLVVRAPLRAGEEKINQFVGEQEKWILKKQAEFKTYPIHSPKEYVNGESFQFLGQTYKLQIEADQKPSLYLNGKFRLAKSALPKAEAVFEKWYRKQALQLLSNRVQWYATKYGYKYKKVRITAARSRWGSCSSTGTLSFAWRLIMAPAPVIDYVIVHELIHLKVKNHSSKFWNEVEAILPDYRNRREWLRKNGHLLDLHGQ